MQPIEPAEEHGVTLTLGPPVRGESMFGRKREIAELRERLRTSHVLLLAPRRVGKTSVMLHLFEYPEPGQDAIFLDVEEMQRPEDFIVALADELQKRDGFAPLVKALKGLDGLRDWLKRVRTIDVASMAKVELTPPVPEDWHDLGGRLFRLLAERAADQRGSRPAVQIILDEFPYFVRRMANTPELGPAAVEDFLSWFRSLRQAPQLGEHVRYLLGGSIGLSGVLGRLRLSALVNDIYSFPLGPFGHDTAVHFLRALERGERFPLDDEERLAFLQSLGHLLPFYIQVLFAEMKHLASNAPPSRSRVDAAMESLLGPRGKVLTPMVERLPDAFPDPDELKLARLILLRACQTREGLPRSEIGQMKDLPDIPDAEERLLSVLDTLEHDGYLIHMPGPDDSPGRYQFLSELLRRWWVVVSFDQQPDEY